MSSAEDPYRVLGVEPDATPAEVRAAYLARARAAHPDRHAGDPDAQRAAEERMRSVNAAWSVLGDPERRAAHDRRAGHLPQEGPLVARPSRQFTPRPGDVDAEDEPDEDAWRHEPDPYDERTAVGRVLGAGPPLLFVVGLVLFAAAAMTGIRALLAAAFAALLVALVAFVGVPIVAVARSKANDPG